MDPTRGPAGRACLAALCPLFAALPLAPALAPEEAPPPVAARSGLGEGDRQEKDAEGAALDASPAAFASERQLEASLGALDRGLAWLAGQQARTEDGSFPKGEAREYAPIGVVALGALAFMSDGSGPDRGPHGREVSRAVDFLLRHVDLEPSSEEHGYIASTSDEISRMHGHGFATLALAQAYSMSPRSQRGRRIGEALVAAVRLIEGSQGTEGGWGYEPKGGIDHEGSITVCLVQALRAARNVGVRVDADVVHRAESYVARSQKPDGSFRYRLHDEDSSLALTAAAVATLQSAGRYSGGIVDGGFIAIERYLDDMPVPALRARKSRFPFYERFYLAQALWQLEQLDAFRQWWERELPHLLEAQEESGAWRDPVYGDSYATAVNCLTIAIPTGLLPIFQR